VGGLAATAAIAHLVTGTWTSHVTGPAATAGDVTWGSTTAFVAGAAVTAVGLALLIAGIKPGAFTSARLHSSSQSAVAERDFVISTRAIARIAADRADLVDGVDKVSASASGRRVHLRVITASQQAAEIRSRVVASVTEALVATGIQPQPRVSVAVRTKEI
jgi:hypothetical protein